MNIINIKNSYYLSCKQETGKNPNGLISIDYDEENTIIVYSSDDENKDKGIITIENLGSNEVKYIFSLINKITYIALSYNGLLLAIFFISNVYVHFSAFFFILLFFLCFFQKFIY